VFKVPDPSKPTISGRTTLKIHSLDIQSPYLVAALKDIVKDEGVNLEVSETAHFAEPFKSLFFSYDKIVSLSQSTTHTTLSQHLKLLITVLNELFGGFMHTLANLKKSRLISYELAWTHFPRGALVYSSTAGCERVCKVVGTCYDANHNGGARLKLDCEEIAFDGVAFSWRPVTLSILHFAGNQPVDQLSHFLLDFHPERGVLERRLRERARKVLDYQELCYREYDGVGTYMKGPDETKHNVCPSSLPKVMAKNANVIQVSGRILIDFNGYNKHGEKPINIQNNPNNPQDIPQAAKEAPINLKTPSKEKQKAIRY
jgi:hypothetical protein